MSGTFAQIQKDLDAFLITYNTSRPHQGRGMKGRTPQQVFKAGLKTALQHDIREQKMNPEKAA